MDRSNHPEPICPHFLHGRLLGLLDIHVARGAARTHGKKRQANNGNGRSRLNWPGLVPNYARISAIPTLKWFVPVQRFRVAAQHHEADDCNSHSDQTIASMAGAASDDLDFQFTESVPAFSYPRATNAERPTPRGYKSLAHREHLPLLPRLDAAMSHTTEGAVALGCAARRCRGFGHRNAERRFRNDFGLTNNHSFDCHWVTLAGLLAARSARRYTNQNNP
jgi:hypothetical protein